MDASLRAQVYILQCECSGVATFTWPWPAIPGATSTGRSDIHDILCILTTHDPVHGHTLAVNGRVMHSNSAHCKEGKHLWQCRV